MEWNYPSSFNPLDYEGFVYLITNNVSGRMYVGRKYVYRFSKGRIVGESDWRSYWGSSKELSSDIEKIGVENFTREILHFCRTKSETNYKEVEEQFRRDVLTARMPNGERAYYNANIMSRYFARTVESYATMRKPSPSIERMEYDKAPNRCFACGGPIQYKRRANQFCSTPCAMPQKKAKMTGRKKLPVSIERRTAARCLQTAQRLGFSTVEELDSEILSLRSSGLRHQDIADRLGCSRKVIARVLGLKS